MYVRRYTIRPVPVSTKLLEIIHATDYIQVAEPLAAVAILEEIPVAAAVAAAMEVAITVMPAGVHLEDVKGQLLIRAYFICPDFESLKYV